MKKSGYVFSIAVMCLAVIVGAVGITAAWFGDTTSVSQVISITSAQPAGTASIIVDSTNPSGDFPTSPLLRPAVLKAGLGLNDHTGANSYDTIAVPYQLNDTNSTIVDTANKYDDGSNSDRPFSMFATTVSTHFDFNFAGDTTFDDHTRVLQITLTSVTLSNPRTNVTNGTEETTDDYTVVHTNLKDYKSEFATIMTISSTNTTAAATLASTYTYPQTQSGHTITFHVMSNASFTYTFNVTVYFAKADEFVSPELIDTRLFFNFELITTDASQT